MGKLIEGFWDCKYCDTTHIRGSVRNCPNCGKPRDENTKFYLENPKDHYVSEEKAKTINRNPDWICPYCGSLNSDNETHCVSCGSLRTKENLDYFQNQVKQQEKEASDVKYESEDNDEDDEDSYFEDSTNQNTKFLLKGFLSKNRSKLLIGLVSVIAVFGLIFLLIPKQTEVTIQSFSWERSIEIERYQTVFESDWSLPAGARLKYTQQEFSHYQSVLSHYETKTRQVTKQRVAYYEEYVSGHRDLGNGYFEEIISTRPVYETYYETETYQDPVYVDEPVYRTKYYYDIDKWLYERSVKTSNSDHTPYWGDFKLNSDEREASRSGYYYISGLDKKEKQVKFSMDLEEWSEVNLGQTVKLNVSFGHGKLVE